MRKFKFRAWNKKTKKMINPHTLTPLALHENLISENVKGVFLPFDKDVILIQYTGLKDKNNKEIYEGDIVKIDKLDKEESSYTMEVEYINKLTVNGFNITEAHLFLHRKPEIIGNIYENPKLLNA